MDTPTSRMWNLLEHQLGFDEEVVSGLICGNNMLTTEDQYMSMLYNKLSQRVQIRILARQYINIRVGAS